ncbi:DNA polymerase III subunit gamma/tau [Leptolyngbya sp. FACHB-17]|uniref:DNA polymerase III subunit gamma/tau n=1 Tax=unclassified Leptolyngbya TaxID=2650499 RepID=UPI00168103E0|nr:DNA polymerase III subunit gamma/tau [Leptolyngbya sp. FACHB-17]
MTYVPLHHKYRPQTFSQLVGQDAIATTLSNALKQNRIAPAYLFTGARGTGKTSSARIFAKSLNCISTNAPTDKPCGVCQTCQEITKGNALDVIEIDAASNTGVDNIRELIERAQFAPVQCRYKTYVIDEVHMLSNASFNALLKTLEEPPEQVVFILATTDPQRVLPTIISRCQRFDFRRIPIDDMTQHLTMIAEKEGIAIAEDALYLIAQISQGGLRDAESLLDQLSLLSGDITVERVWDLVGAVPERDLMALVEAIAQNQPETVLDTTRRLMDRGREPLIVLQNLASFYRDLLIAKTAPDRGDLVALTSPTWVQLCEFAKGVSIGTILAGQQRLKESELQLKNSTQPRLWLEVTLMGLLPSAVTTESTQPIAAQPIAAQPIVAQPIAAQPIAKPVQTIAPPIPEPIKPPVPATTPEPIPKPIQESPDSDLTDLEQLWQTIISNLQPLGTQALLKQQGSLLSFDGEVAQIGVAQKLLGLAQGRSKNIAAALTKTFGKEIKFSLVVAPTTAVTSPTPPPAPSPTEPSEPALPPFSNPTPPVTTNPEPHSESTSEEPPQPSYKRSDWEDDEVARAARTLAEAFNGSVVDADEAEIEAIGTPDEIPELEDAIDDEDDTEF